MIVTLFNRVFTFEVEPIVVWPTVNTHQRRRLAKLVDAETKVNFGKSHRVNRAKALRRILGEHGVPDAHCPGPYMEWVLAAFTNHGNGGIA
jgi:hypothetical protein